MQFSRSASSVPLILFSVLLVQLIGRYYGDNFIIGRSFHLWFFIGRIFVPLFLAFFLLKMSAEDLGLSLPRTSKAWNLFLASALVLTPMIVSLILLDASYLRAYPYYTDASVPAWTRMADFGVFTLSTLVGWEFMHRSFLLFGLYTSLRRWARLESNWAISLAVSVTAAYEVLFHFLKPDLEAIGLLFASPLLSWMAIRTKSFWLPALIHLYIEICFIGILVLKHS